MHFGKYAPEHAVDAALHLLNLTERVLKHPRGDPRQKLTPAEIVTMDGIRQRLEELRRIVKHSEFVNPHTPHHVCDAGASIVQRRFDEARSIIDQTINLELEHWEHGRRGVRDTVAKIGEFAHKAA